MTAEPFKFSLMDYVRIKDYNRHGMITERLNGQREHIYGVIEPNLNHFFWLESDLSHYPNPNESLVQNVQDGNSLGGEEGRIRNRDESRIRGVQGRLELHGSGMPLDDGENTSGPL